MTHPGGVMRIVVGLDGSPESQRALAWAAVQAVAHDAHLRVLYAFGAAELFNPYTAAVGEGELPVLGPAARKHAQRAIDRIVHGVLGPGHGLPLEVQVVGDDRPARALIEASADADLLVVGSRGRGGLAGLLLGSVSAQCVQQARCPVTVVPMASERALLRT